MEIPYPDTNIDAVMLALNKMKPELTSLLNRCGVDGAMETPDYLLSEFVFDALVDLDKLRRTRDDWFRVVEEAEG